ncbi:MAG: hypothetical protein V1777_00185 [Candidatus Micrarchaeota archaeon]
MVSTRPIVGRVKRKWVPTRPLSQAEHWQLRDWRKGKDVPKPGFVRLMRPDDRLATLVVRRARFGRNIKMQQIGSVPRTGFEKKELRQIQQEIQERWGTEFGSKKLVSLLAKARTLRISVALRAALGGRDPNVFQVLALTALKNGLDSAELNQQAKTMSTLYQRHRTKVTWEGNVSTLRQAIQLRLPSGQSLLVGVEKKLFQSKNQAIDANVLCQQLGLEWNRKNQILLNGGLQLLETAGLVKKMPQASLEKSFSIWCHAAHSNPAVDYPNTQFDILRRLTHGPKSAAELYKTRSDSYGRRFGNPKAAFGRNAVMLALEELAKAELVTTAKQKNLKNGVYARGTSMVINSELTGLGRRLLQEHDKNNSLPEWARKLLLGEKEN